MADVPRDTPPQFCRFLEVFPEKFSFLGSLRKIPLYLIWPERKVQNMEEFDREDEEYLGALLYKIKGSLSEERRNSKPKNFNRSLRKLRVLQKQYRIQFFQIVSNPSLLEIRMAEIAALDPTSIQVDFRIKGIGKILGKNQYRRIKQVLIFLILTDLPEWIKFYLECEFLKLVPKNIEQGIQAELRFFAMIVQMERTQRIDILNKMYPSHSLKEMEQAGAAFLCKNIYFDFFDTTIVKCTERKRGYSDKGSTIPESEKKRRKSMREIEKEIELVKQEILLKQMKMFEKNLDRILELDSSKDKKEIQEILDTQNQKLYEKHNT